MRRLAHLITLLVSLALVAGAVINVAQATSMAMDMAAGAHLGESMSGCDGCPGGDDGGMACAAVCLAPATAVLPEGTSIDGVLTRMIIAARTQALADHSRPPDPYPPRATVLGSPAGP
jgi:hypothetical protein